MRCRADFIIRSALLMLFATGCGYDRYEARLKETAQFYEYLEEVDANLAAPGWSGSGVSMRVPLPFSTPLAGPERVIDSEGNAFLGPDPRHPHVLGVELPGILSAWQAPLSTESDGVVDARFYILGNHDRFLSQQDGGPTPLEFLSELEMTLQSAFNVVIPDGESPQGGDNVRTREMIPPQQSPNAKYTSPKSFTAIRYVPAGLIGGADLQGLLYEHLAGDVQVAILILCPKSITSQFRQRIDLALQTLQVSSQIPTRAGAAGGGGTSGSGQNF